MLTEHNMSFLLLTFSFLVLWFLNAMWTYLKKDCAACAREGPSHEGLEDWVRGHVHGGSDRAGAPLQPIGQGRLPFVVSGDHQGKRR